jgi:hypothetical protein
MRLLRAVSKPIQAWGDIHNLTRSSLVIVAKPTSLRKYPQLNWRPQEINNTTFNHLGFQDSKSKSFSLSHNQILKKSSLMHQMQWQERRVLISFTLKFHKRNSCYEDMRGRIMEESTKNSKM